MLRHPVIMQLFHQNLETAGLSLHANLDELLKSSAERHGIAAQTDAHALLVGLASHLNRAYIPPSSTSQPQESSPKPLLKRFFGFFSSSGETRGAADSKYLNLSDQLPVSTLKALVRSGKLSLGSASDGQGSDSAVDAAIEQAVNARLLTRRSSPDRVAFTHPIWASYFLANSLYAHSEDTTLEQALDTLYNVIYQEQARLLAGRDLSSVSISSHSALTLEFIATRVLQNPETRDAWAALTAKNTEVWSWEPLLKAWLTADGETQTKTAEVWLNKALPSRHSERAKAEPLLIHQLELWDRYRKSVVTATLPTFTKLLIPSYRALADIPELTDSNLSIWENKLSHAKLTVPQHVDRLLSALTSESYRNYNTYDMPRAIRESKEVLQYYQHDLGIGAITEEVAPEYREAIKRLTATNRDGSPFFNELANLASLLNNNGQADIAIPYPKHLVAYFEAAIEATEELLARPKYSSQSQERSSIERYLRDLHVSLHNSQTMLGTTLTNSLRSGEALAPLRDTYRGALSAAGIDLDHPVDLRALRATMGSQLSENYDNYSRRYISCSKASAYLTRTLITEGHLDEALEVSELGAAIGSGLLGISPPLEPFSAEDRSDLQNVTLVIEAISVLAESILRYGQVLGLTDNVDDSLTVIKRALAILRTFMNLEPLESVGEKAYAAAAKAYLAQSSKLIPTISGALQIYSKIAADAEHFTTALSAIDELTLLLRTATNLRPLTEIGEAEYSAQLKIADQKMSATVDSLHDALTLRRSILTSLGRGDEAEQLKDETARLSKFSRIAYSASPGKGDTIVKLMGFLDNLMSSNNSQSASQAPVSAQDMIRAVMSTQPKTPRNSAALEQMLKRAARMEERLKSVGVLTDDSLGPDRAPSGDDDQGEPS